MELFDYFVGLGANPLLLDCRGCNGLHYAARANNLGALKKILEGKPGVNIIDGFGWTPLHWAAASKSKSAQVIKALVDQGCNKDLKDKARRTALDLAAIFENTESVAILNDMDNECTDLSNNGASTAKEPTNYECDGCAIVRIPFKHDGSQADRLLCRYPTSVGGKNGTSAQPVTNFSISAFDVLWTRISYTPAAILGPIKFLQLSNGLNRILSLRHGENAVEFSR